MGANFRPRLIKKKFPHQRSQSWLSYLIIETTGIREVAISISHKVVHNVLILTKLATMSSRLYLGYLDKTMNNFETMNQNQLNRFILKKKQLPHAC